MRSGEPAALLIGGRACESAGLVAAHRAAAATGEKVLGETFLARLERGAGPPSLDRLSYLAEFAADSTGPATRRRGLPGTRDFFAYPEAERLVPKDCQVHFLAGDGDDPVSALEALADAVARRS